MDLHGGALYYEGIEALHSIDTGGIPNQPSLLPSTMMFEFIQWGSGDRRQR